MNEPAVAAIILAAGASTRMGALKQLLPYRGRPLLIHAVETALAGGCQTAVVVLGCQADALRHQLHGLPVHVAENSSWAEGLGTSISRGVEAADSLPDAIEAVLLMLCDQPLIMPDLLHCMIAAYCEGKRPIIACEYANTMGPPALFARRYFSDLKALRGTKGAKHLLESHRDEVGLISCPAAQTDVDTPSDYAGLR
ncbi:MAG: nucleotidyltransferase family protein [Bacillota bacterium]